MHQEPQGNSHHDKRATPPLLPAASPPTLPHQPVSATLPPKLPPHDPLNLYDVSSPKSAKTAGSFGRILKPAVTIGGMAVLIVFGLLVGVALLKQVTKRDTLEDYVFLCQTLFGKIKLEGAVLPSDAETEIEAQNSSAEINRISNRGKNLAPIAQGLIYLENQRAEIVKDAPNGKALFSGAVDVVSGLNSGKNADVWSGIMKALPDIASGAKTIDEAMNLEEKRHQLAIILTKFAPQFSGPLTNGSLLSFSFSEHLPILFQVDTVQSIGLANSSGSDLHNCVIFARLSDASGNSYVNLHFAPNWPKDGKLEAKYVSSDFPTPTVENVTRVDISVWTSEFSFDPMMLKKPVDGWPEPN